jgi:hypothetical protein
LASKDTQITYGPVTLSLYHSGVLDHQDHFWAVGAVPISFRRRRVAQDHFEAGPTKTLLIQSGCVYLIPASKATKITTGSVGLCLSHSGVGKVTKTASGPVGPYLTHSGVKGHLNHFWAGRAVTISFRRRRVTQDTFRPLGLRLPHSGVESTKTTSGPVELCQSHSGVEKLSRPLQGWSGRIFLIPATKGHPDHFWAGRTVMPISLRRRMPPRPLLSRSGCIYLIPASKSCQERFWAGQAVSISFRRRRSLRPLLGQSVYTYLILASKGTQNTFRPVGLCLQGWSGRIYLIPATKGNPDHFWAGQTVPISLRRRRPPRPLLDRSGCVYPTPASKGHLKHF